MPFFTVRGYILYYAFFGLYNLNLFSLLLKFDAIPIVNHPDYVAKINDDNKFPIKKFGALADHLLKSGCCKSFIFQKNVQQKQ